MAEARGTFAEIARSRSARRSGGGLRYCASRNARLCGSRPTRASAEAASASRSRTRSAAARAPAPGTPEVANRLGWLTIAERMQAKLGELDAFTAEVREEGTRDVVLLGMGGSSLAPEVLRRSFAPRDGYPRLHVLDSTDAATILR